MKIFAIADLHLSFHKNINKPMDVYGKEWENHTQRIKNNWQENVADEDLIIIAGDVSWGLKLEEALPDLEWIDSLPGTKIITKGNHDLWWAGINKLNSLFDSITFLQNKAYLFGDAVIYAARGWLCPGSEGFSEEDLKIYKREILRLKMSIEDGKRFFHSSKYNINKKIGILHYPPTNEKKEESEFTKIFTQERVDNVV